MGFHTEAELRNLGQQVADAAEGAYLREQAKLNHRSGAGTGGFNIPMPGDRFYSTYPDLYARFATPDPAGMQPALDKLGRASFVLTGDFPVKGGNGENVPVPGGDIGDLAGKDTPDAIAVQVTDKIRNWNGPARDAFHEKVLSSFEQTTGNQVIAINKMAGSLALHMTLRNKLNENVWDIGQKSIEAFNQVGTTSGGDAIQATLLVAGAVATVWTVWGGALGAGGGIVAGLRGVSAKDAASITLAFNNIRNSPQVTEVLSHDSAAKVGSSMESFLGKAANSYREQEKDVIAALNQLSSGMKQYPQIFEFSSPEVETLDDQEGNLPTLESQFHD